MDVTSGTLATLLFMLLAAVVIWLVRRYYQRHTYEPIKPFKRKDIMINIGCTITSRYCHWNEFSNDGNNRSSTDRK